MFNWILKKFTNYSERPQRDSQNHMRIRRRSKNSRARSRERTPERRGRDYRSRTPPRFRARDRERDRDRDTNRYRDRDRGRERDREGGSECDLDDGRRLYNGKDGTNSNVLHGQYSARSSYLRGGDRERGRSKDRSRDRGGYRSRSKKLGRQESHRNGTAYGGVSDIQRANHRQERRGGDSRDRNDYHDRNGRRTAEYVYSGSGVSGGSRRYGRDRTSKCRRDGSREVNSRKRRRDYDTTSKRGREHDGAQGYTGHSERDSHSGTDTRRSSKRKSRKRRQSCDDAEGRLIVIPGDYLHGQRYKIIKELGEGTFGKVIACHDTKLNREVAVKVIKNVPKYRDAAKIEISILEALQKHDTRGDTEVIHMLSSFDHRNHMCMVFEVLGENVYEFIKDNGYRGLPFHHVQSMARELLKAVKFIHSIKLTHTDLKPENILFVNSSDYFELTLPSPNNVGYSDDNKRYSNNSNGASESGSERDSPNEVHGIESLTEGLGGHGDEATESRDVVGQSGSISDTERDVLYDDREASSNGSTSKAERDRTSVYVNNILRKNVASDASDNPDDKKSATRTVKVLRDPSIRLIDFGSATWEDQHHTAIVATRHYRPPEVILELGWSYPCDIWSVGCILFEFYTGDALFQTHDSLEHLAMMEVILEKRVPSSMLQDTKKVKLLDSSRKRLAWPEKAPDDKAIEYVEQCRTLKSLMHEQTDEHNQFLDLIRNLLKYRPEDRLTASEALRHPFFDAKL
ncbi:CMGC/CLK protein kinase [Sphaeroforma arctica JP610]|uniref:CMGC/CLK protein kinase n=1 Tax=Sphaeroforma arctica JP610 TaxID=667725 RepID=A0A0L0FZY6_9EUKA|nr:CMGC/CLK protein kinase [Sphaeroforma arctica JP610]KNC82427.1 CMGC/CLK protein kinase [Sphaeroforma arctica JP610]|eukprot:XP_014156329.1 CMGC/CLK protein kinase [Sphaeroforma arctica JP610]